MRRQASRLLKIRQVRTVRNVEDEEKLTIMFGNNLLDLNFQNRTIIIEELVQLGLIGVNGEVADPDRTHIDFVTKVVKLSVCIT